MVQKSQVRYAYLADVPGGDVDLWRVGSPFGESKWFTRGWTLQELLAPEAVIFFNHDWQEIGTRSSLGSLIASITGIETHFLRDHSTACVAQKMSWASSRETLRDEDLAYSLLGLFSVHMPLLYGEGTQAFRRLQTEIIKISTDESIFAWADAKLSSSEKCGMLAPSPASFQQSSHVRSNDAAEGLYSSTGVFHGRGAPFHMSNRGLEISSPLLLKSSIMRRHQVLDDSDR